MNRTPPEEVVFIAGSGRSGTSWVNQFNHAPNSQSVLIKAIRANLLLPWLQRQLPWVKLILIVRHPIPVVLSHLDVERFHLVFYERLVEQPDIEFGRLEDFLGHPLPETAREAWNRSSASSRLDSAVGTGADRIRSWLGSVKQPYLRMADEILSWFGLNKFYASGQPTPLKSNAGV